VDTVSKTVRSKIMSAVKPSGNKTTEVAMAAVLRIHGLGGYRRHWLVAGKPDFAWPKIKTALFVDGCFWHGCPRCQRFPSTNVEFWTNRIATNRRRDRRVARNLRAEGWSVMRVWECSVGKERTVRRIRAVIEARRRAISS
jgi:DNA mismatch endonuclease (patch repair protein)